MVEAKSQQSWSELPIWAFTQRKVVKNRPDEQLLSVYRDWGVVPKDSRDDNHNRASEDLSAYQFVEPGDLVLNKMKTWQGSIAVSDHQGIVSPAYYVCSVSGQHDRRFLHHLLRHKGMIEEYRARSKGIRPNQWDLPFDEFRAIKVAIPPLEEQQIIAAYLDRETGRIDALVERLERLIALLTEKRQAVISHAVTKGLNPDAPMKDSGIDWLGEVPAHWEVGKLLRFARLESGHTPSRKEPGYWENCIHPWVSLSDVSKFRDNYALYVSETKEKISDLGLANSAARLLPKDTVILSRTASVGFATKLATTMATTQDFVNWICGPNLEPDYLLAIFWAMKPEFERLKYGSTHNTIYMPDVRAFQVCVPPKYEQDRIVTEVRAQLETFATSLSAAEKTLAMLKERRSALISAAVTGQIPIAEMIPDTQPEDAA